MYKPVPLSWLDGKELIPQAIIDRPISHFAERFKLSFTRGHDDFDRYDAAAIQLNDGLVFELKRYAGYPDNTTTIYLPYDINSIEQISNVISMITSEFNIPRSWISWQRSDDPEL